MGEKHIFLFKVLSIVLFIFFLIFPPYASAQDYEVYTAKGIQKINEGKMKDALEFFEKALELAPDDPEVTYYAGIANSRLGNYDKAEALFKQTLDIDETAVNVYLELGRLYYETLRCDKAEAFLLRFIALSDDESLRDYACALIKDCKREVEEKPYKLNVSVGGQYDSNVVLEPSNPPVGADRKSDARSIAYISSGATILEKWMMKLKADYKFYQSLHWHLNNFNVHYHKITPAIEFDVSDLFTPSVGYRFEYTLFGGELYSRLHTYYGNVTVKEGENFSTEAIYEYSDNRYWDSDLFQANSVRTGYQNSGGLKQNFYLNRLKADIYYFIDFNRAREEYWAFDGHRIGAELTYKIMAPLYISASGEYNQRRYREVFPDYNEKRSDTTQQYYVGLTYFIRNNMSVSITESFTINDSNIVDFDYNRDITGIFFTVGVL